LRRTSRAGGHVKSIRRILPWENPPCIFWTSSLGGLIAGYGGCASGTASVLTRGSPKGICGCV
jgi:hypothetical protein